MTRLPGHRMSAPREPRHAPVLAAEVLDRLGPRPGETWVDCTVGGGGHSLLIADRVGASGRLVGLDQDPTMLDLARPRLDAAGARVTLVHANFDQLAGVLENLGIDAVDGVLADLGFASDQMDAGARGLSFREDGPLDMRLDPTAGATAADLVNAMSEAALADVFFEFGEERHSRRVARKVVERRATRPFATTADFAAVVRSCVPRSGGIDPATRVFQALRIAVNDELGALDRLLAALPKLVRPGGRAGVISFHSLEDRRVKQAFRGPPWEPVTKKPVEAGDEELARNPRSRSAKLRVARRT
ncbi:16s rrna methyltransferase : Ribosomal RNA small subunit methyltransferase H OS=Singulisphaera acidiphila (strain ATCC BAA-1392 / DSM 18658 / VKM B-2454 / MOB10) GN=rsmH PE=3 SV=1: Methyltransf_5 [Gemmataceae bacterium]|nr:16s rrna methyltransferase : Ribosomal RNA small subunit methyltransferase H OS=Singulisphaera acidiphila (strain ATCC BAA-1392 / DSM 18658 / VKM B-2454 / MOB10) GN=rsmH PE=3 SV=1: Methyltransf_5 [Gemmataceae bacterium]VTU00601.1 16s rrna methyltransferase : Ribosomal RNA small subunit methyltransferase H OS=Singulisphaera acidiphila (strain ATCC BAA-1392 / DSM 18658 / VKM B-2454 / MOB10) GN=rsmH PE=3 SV=1: Methyltransf_5 [Gemmataceae bacterium]